MGMAGQFGLKSGPENVRFPITRDACGATKVGQAGPSRLGFERDSQVARLDTVSRIEVEIGFSAMGLQHVLEPIVKLPVKIVRMQDSDRFANHFGGLEYRERNF
jgi:hypothetical protein